MKSTTTSILLLIWLWFPLLKTTAQDQAAMTQNEFVRVYDLQGKKIGKGRIVAITKDFLTINRSKTNITIPVDNIGMIKTKRSFGHNVGVGSMAGLGIGMAYGLAVGQEGGLLGVTSDTDNALAFGIVGLPLGTALGAVTGIFKKSQEFAIHGESYNLLKFKAITLNQGN